MFKNNVQCQSTKISHIADMWQNFAKYTYNCNGNYKYSRSALLYSPKTVLLPFHTWLEHSTTAHSKKHVTLLFNPQKL
jgi:hypothetical protein